MHLAKKWQNSDGNKKKADFYITYWQPLTFFCIFFISHKRFEKQLPTFDLHGKKRLKLYILWQLRITEMTITTR